MKKVTVIAILALAGCSQTPGQGTMALVGPLPSAGIIETTAAYQSVAVAEAVPAEAVTLGPVTGTSCKNSLLDPAPSQESALIQVREKAAAMGATGVHSIAYGTDPNPISKNCWAIITATGTAYAVK